MPAPPDLAARATAWAARTFPEGLFCPCCRHRTFVVEEAVLAPAVINGVQSKTEMLVAVPFVCAQCQYILLFQGEPLGVTLGPA